MFEDLQMYENDNHMHHIIFIWSTIITNKWGQRLGSGAVLNVGYQQEFAQSKGDLVGEPGESSWDFPKSSQNEDPCKEAKVKLAV